MFPHRLPVRRVCSRHEPVLQRSEAAPRNAGRRPHPWPVIIYTVIHMPVIVTAHG